jgi:DNA-binding SARP family transcriptional activator
MRPVRIRLLGELEVLRPDGTAVGPEEWRTGKTADLLRLLALNNGRIVRQSSLVAKLWPDVASDKAGASLRTAASQIRRATGENCIARQPGGLLLQGAWVDVTQFEVDSRGVHVAYRGGHHVRAVNLARAAERLYRDDFHAHDDHSDWARDLREELAHRRQRMLCDAAEAAIELEMYREAVEFAATAVQLDRSSEAAHRALMHAHAQVGEIGSALRVFEAFRTHLAEELGADPSPQTQTLHLRLLRGNRA